MVGDQTQAMLKASQEVDDKINAHAVQQNKALADVGTLEAVKPHPIEELVLEDADADPFGGNHNNRRVADRISREYKERKFLNSSAPTHTGDPEKAAADVAQSLRVTGQDINYGRTGDAPEVELPRQLNLPKPSQDSPAAKKAAAEKATEVKSANAQPAVPSWKPNAA
jgi:hypothetical protein